MENENEVQLIPVEGFKRRAAKATPSDWDVLAEKLTGAEAGQWFQVTGVNLARYKKLAYARVGFRQAADRVGIKVGMSFRDGVAYVTRKA